MNISKFVTRLGLALAAIVALAPANALTTVQGGIFFDLFTTNSAHTSSYGSAYFAFDIEDVFAPDTTPGEGYGVENISNFIYELDGVDVPEALLRIEFYPESLGGLFSLVFASQTLNFFGNDIGSTGVLTQGIFFASGVYDDSDPFGDGVAVIAVGVPEPATWAMLLIGFGATGAMLRRRRLAAA